MSVADNENSSSSEVKTSEAETETVSGSPCSCQVCGAPSTSFCRKCGVAYYCSREHQKQDWKIHKRSCFPVKVEKSTKEEGIFELVAARDICKDEEFLKEDPLLIFPHGSYTSQKVCLECCSVEGEEMVACPECGWKLCSEACVKGKYHSQYECKIFAKRGIRKETIHPENLNHYFLIGMIRALLIKEEDEEKWSKIKKLNSFKTQRNLRPENVEVRRTFGEFIRKDCGMDQYDEDEVDFVFGVLRGNSIDVSDYQTLVPRNTTLLYAKAVQIGESCIANARLTIHGANSSFGTYKLFMFANTPIPQGTPISISFEQGLTSTFLRRSLKNRLFFRECLCERCSDPTELGTFIGALKCKKCRRGYYLQTDPTKLEKSDWKCNDPQCEDVLEDMEMAKIIDEASCKMKVASVEGSLQSVEKMLKCITHLKKDLLHPNHFIILNAEIDICKRLLTLSGQVDISDKGRLMVEIGKHLLSVGDVLAPGSSRFRGHILYYFQFGIINQVLREGSRNYMRKMKEGSARARKKLMDECTKYQEEVRKIFSVEPEDTEEYYLLQTMKANTDIMPY